jgi:multidrug efflux pump subunit AcrB
VTGNVSKAIASRGKVWSGKNVTRGQTGAGTQLTDSFVTMAHAMLVGIGPDYMLLVPLVIFFALPLAVVGAVVALALIGHATNIITSLAVSLQATVLPVAVAAREGPDRRRRPAGGGNAARSL